MLLAVSLVEPANSATSFAQLYQDAIIAREQGNFPAAIENLELALALEPGNADALLVLGLLYGYQQRLDESRATLEHAKDIAPDYLDVGIALSRVLSWQGSHEEADRVIDEVLQQEPQDRDARHLKARIALYRGDMALADALYRALLTEYPDDAEARQGLQRTSAMENAPIQGTGGSPQVASIESQSLEAEPALTGPETPVHRWRLDSVLSYSDLARSEQSAWREGAVQLGYAVSPETRLRVRSEFSRRFDRNDTYIEGAIDQIASDWARFYVGGGGTLRADFRERWAVIGGASLRVKKGGGFIDTTLLLADFKHADYESGGVETLKTGLQQYFLDGRVWGTGQWINIWDEDGTRDAGWLVRGDVLVTDWLSLRGGAAEVAETENNDTVDTFTVFAGIGIALSEEVHLTFDYGRDDREDSYLRHSFSLGMTLRY